MLTACGSTTQKRLESYCTHMVQSTNMTMTAKLQADFDETVENYTLRYSFDGQQWTVLVTEPAFVSGITARITKDASELEYDGAILTTGDLTGNGIVPISAMPLVYETLCVGMLDCVWEEGEKIAATYVYDDAISVSVWFDSAGSLVAAELVENGIVKARCLLEDVEIKEANHGTTEETDLGGDQSGESGT